jgi:beta-fructofuranosidase
VRADPADRERTAVEVSRAVDGPATLRLDRATASLDATVDTRPLAGTVPVGEDGEVALRVLVDASTVEVFGNGRALTARVYPTLPEATGASLEAVRGEVRLLGGEVRRLARAVQR